MTSTPMKSPVGVTLSSLRIGLRTETPQDFLALPAQVAGVKDDDQPPPVLPAPRPHSFQRSPSELCASAWTGHCAARTTVAQSRRTRMISARRPIPEPQLHVVDERKAHGGGAARVRYELRPSDNPIRKSLNSNCRLTRNTSGGFPPTCFLRLVAIQLQHCVREVIQLQHRVREVKRVDGVKQPLQPAINCFDLTAWRPR